MNNIIIDPDLLEFTKQETLENKAKAFDTLVKILNIDFPFDNSTNFLKIRNGFESIDFPISYEEYEILKKVID